MVGIVRALLLAVAALRCLASPPRRRWRPTTSSPPRPHISGGDRWRATFQRTRLRGGPSRPCSGRP